MTVSTTINKVSYIGNGVATSFAIPFPFLEKEHLKVYQLLNDIQTERADWSLSNGNMVFETAPADGAQILIMREVPLTQETDYRENEVLPAETLERNFDKLTMQVQQLKEQADRAVTVDVFDDTVASDLIPSIRQAVSDCAEYAATATQKALNAAGSAQTASDKADIATNKATEVSNALSTKANIDADNFSQTGKKTIIRSVLPSSQSENLSVVSGQTVTANANGYITIAGTSQTVSRALLVITNTTTGLSNGDHSYSAGTVISAFLPVTKNDEVSVIFDNITISTAKFIPAQGEL